MPYEYKMVQVPPNIQVEQKEYQGGEAAAYLEEIVNAWAAKGWDFYRVDSLGVQVKPGCLASLSNKEAETLVYYVITFRHEK